MPYKDSEKKKEHNKEYRQKNKEKLKQKAKEYGQKPEVIQRKKEYMKKYHKKYRQKNKERFEKYYQKNRKKIINQVYQYQKERIKQDINFKIKRMLRGQLWRALKNYTKTGKIMPSKKYGGNYKAIFEHLKPFPKNLSKYHIDHIKPLCSFNFINPNGSTNFEEVKKAFAPENHQWLLAKENLSKGGKIEPILP